MSYTENSSGNVTSAAITDALGTERNRQFDYELGVIKNTGLSEGGYSLTKSYDANGNLTSETDYNGNLTCYQYDLTHNLESARVEGFAPGSTCPSDLSTYTPASASRQRKIQTTWDTALRLPTLITEADHTTAFYYDASGNLLTRTVTDTATSQTRTWAYTYNGLGQVLTEDGPRTDVSDVTTNQYYNCTTGSACGQLYTVQNALGQTTTFNAYNAHGQPTQITDPNGVVTTLAYDSRERLTARCVNGSLPTCSGGELTAIQYWPTGLLKQVTLPDGSYTAYAYDDAHRLHQVSDGLGNYVVYSPDLVGNVTGETTYDPLSTLSTTLSRQYNSLSQLWKQIGAAGTAAVTTTFGYDGNGNQTSAAAPLGRNTSIFFDELNRPKQVTDPMAGNTYFDHDANDNLVSVTDPLNLTTAYTYNGFGDLTSVNSPATGVTSQTYDSGGNLQSSQDARSAVATYSHDALNRVTQIQYASGGTPDQTISFSYDTGANGKGHLTGTSDANHALAWTYDAEGHVTSRTQIIGGVTLSAGYGYTNGRLTTLTTPSGQSITYGYSNGRPTSISINGSPLLSGVQYEPFGPVRSWSWGNVR